MQRPRRDSKDSTARSRSAPSTPRVDIIVLTTDLALLATLREAAGPAHQLLHAESPENAVDLLIGGRCGIFIVDVTLVRERAVDLFHKLQAQFPEVVLLATGRRDEQNAITGLIGSGRIYRFLHKPVSPARAELFLSAAARRYGELHAHDARATFNPLISPRGRAALLAASIAAIVVPLALWTWTQFAAPKDSASLAAELSDTRSASDELLRRADAAFDAHKYVSPENDNALDLYRSVLRLDPSNSAAQRGLDRLADTFAQQAAQALAGRDAAQARQAVDELGRIAPQHQKLAGLQDSLARLSRAPTAQPAKSLASAPRPQVNAPPMTPRPATPNVDTARARLAANQLIEPADDNALLALRRARTAEEDESAIQIAATDLGTRLLNRTLLAIESNDAAGARLALDSASAIDREFETALPDLDRVAARIAALERETQRSSTDEAIERLVRLRRSDQLIEPAGDNAVEALKSALQSDPESAALKAEQRQLSLALIEHTRTALAAGDVDRADVLAGRAEEVLPGLPQTRALREQIGAARAQRDSSAVIQAASLPRRREIPAIYPRDALLKGIEGWVDLEFTISEQGAPEDIRVKNSQPPRVFDVSAVQALRQWRFEPQLSDGAATSRRATLRMEFKLKG